MIRQIVGRCHVGDSDLKVIRYFLTCLKKGAWRQVPKNIRKDTLREVLRTHHENQGLYYSVMTGRF